MSQQYIPGLDGFRFFCALSVFLAHFLGAYHLDSLLIHVPFGMLGVSGFFVLSGFLITRGLLNQPFEKSSVILFFKKRFLRILPLYYLGVVVYLLFFYWKGITGERILNSFAWFFFYFQNIADTFNFFKVGPEHFWSLAIEEHFYIIWPFLVFFVIPKKRKQVFLSLFLIAIVSKYVLFYIGYKPYYFSISRFDDFAVGSLFAYHFPRYQSTCFFRRRGIILVAVLFVGIVQLLDAFPLEITGQVLKYPVISIGCLLGIQEIIFRCNKHSYFFKFMEFFSYGGKISYGLYVWHPIVLLCFREFGLIGDGSLFEAVFLFGSTFVISAVVFELFEKYFLGIKTKLVQLNTPKDK